MQSKTTRGLRRLLVSTGVISLVLSVAAPAALAGQPDDLKVWVCHGTGSETNPFELNHVASNAVAHEDEVVQLTDSDIKNKADLNKLSEAELLDIIDGTCGQHSGGEGSEKTLPTTGGEVVVTPPGQGGEIPGTGEQTPPNQGGVDPVVVTPPTADVQTPPGQDGVIPDVGEQTEEPTAPKGDEPKKGETIISTVTVTRPAVATPATPASPATPATPAAPAAPQAPAAKSVTNTPTAPTPSVAVSATSRGNEVLGSVTTRTPGGAQVTALAATGTSTTVALAALGAVLLLAGFGLQVTARRVQSTAVGA